MSKKQLSSYADELCVSVRAICDIETRHAGFLLNQDQCGRRAAGVIHSSLDRTREQFSTPTEERVFSHAQSELLKSDVKLLASRKSDLPGGGLSFPPLDTKTTETEDFDTEKRERDRERKRRQRERREQELKAKEEKDHKTADAGIRLKVGSENRKEKSKPKS